MLYVRLLGAMELELDGALLEPPASHKVRSLLAWLSLHPGEHPRGRVAGSFWPEVTEQRARASLRSALWSLRQDLGLGSQHLASSQSTVALTGQGLRVDTREFDDLMQAGRVQEAMELYRGDLLPELDDEWVHAERDRLRDRAAALAGCLAEAAEQDERLEDAIAWSRRTVELDPASEEASRSLMRRLLLAGDRPAALAAFNRFRSRLSRELGIRPSKETVRLADRIRTGSRATTPGARRTAEPPLHGRRRELDALRAAWSTAASGSGGAMLIEGAPGLGKTRLLDELIERARSEGAIVARGVASALSSGSPLAPLTEALRVAWDAVRPEDLPSTGLPSILGYEAADSGRGSAEPIKPGDAGPSPDLRHAELFEAAVAVLELATRTGPLIIALDDMHLADAQSHELAAYLALRAAHLPVLLMIACRPGPVSTRLTAALRSGSAALHNRLELDALDLESSRKLATALGLSDARAVDRVVGLADGNPFLLSALVQEMSEGSAAPSGIRDVARAWLAPLSAEARDTVELVAVAGRELSGGELDFLRVLPRDATSAIGSGLLVGRDGRLHFRHELLRDVVYGEIPDPRRSSLHERLAGALEQGAAGQPARAAELAAHWQRAGRSERAAAALRRAARHARSLGALDEAAQLLERAVGFDGRDAESWLELAEIEAWRYRREASDRAFRIAVEASERPGPRWTVSAWLRRASWYQGPLCAPASTHHAASKALEIVEIFELRDRDVRMRALASLAWAEAIIGPPEEAERLIAELSPAAPADELLRCDLAEASGVAAMRRGDFERGAERCSAAARAAGRAGRPDRAAGAWSSAAVASAAAGDLDRALGFVDEALRTTRGRGLSSLAAQLHASRARLLARLGRADEAAAAIDAASELAELVGEHDLVAETDHERGMIALESERYAEAAEFLGRALERSPRVSRPLARLRRAEALAQADRADEGERELRQATLEPVGPGDFPHALVPRIARTQGLVAAARGDAELARERLREAAAGWRRRLAATQRGEAFATAVADLGRAPITGLVEPERELAQVEREIGNLEGEVS